MGVLLWQRAKRRNRAVANGRRLGWNSAESNATVYLPLHVSFYTRGAAKLRRPAQPLKLFV